MNCLYNIHKKNPPALDNEPKYADIRALTGFKIEALYARVSILEFLGILHKGPSSFAEPGQETTDLGIKQNVNGAADLVSATIIEDMHGETLMNCYKQPRTHEKQVQRKSPNQLRFAPIILRSHLADVTLFLT